MLVFTAALQLETLFELNRDRRIVSTREPNPGPGPAFFLVRTATDCAWAVRVDIPSSVVEQLGAARKGRTTHLRFQTAPVNANRYLSLLSDTVTTGPAFTFQELMPEFSDIVAVEDVRLVQRSFRGWLDEKFRAVGHL